MQATRPSYTFDPFRPDPPHPDASPLPPRPPRRPTLYLPSLRSPFTATPYSLTPASSLHVSYDMKSPPSSSFSARFSRMRAPSPKIASPGSRPPKLVTSASRCNLDAHASPAYNTVSVCTRRHCRLFVNDVRRRLIINHPRPDGLLQAGAAFVRTLFQTADVQHGFALRASPTASHGGLTLAGPAVALAA